MIGYKTSMVRRAAALGLLGIALALGGCGDDREEALAGYYVNTADAKDVIEIMTGGEARVTALMGQRIDVWDYGGRARTQLGRAMQDARAAVARYETVEVTYELPEKGDALVFKAEGRGQRMVRFNAETGILKDAGGRQYLRTKKR
ncbi:MAG TPA: hypothetical protein VF274_02760 [Alphaproteobacteria bacterium]